MKEFLGVIVPSLPPKMINFDIERRYSNVHKVRKRGLPDFLNKVIAHPKLSQSVPAKRFLLEKNTEVWYWS